MSNEEHQELNSWIAVNLFSAKCGHIWSVESGQSRCSKCHVQWHENRLIEKYTTNPAAAMEVLKKCALKEGHNFVSIGEFENEWVVENSDVDGAANTLELAICLFAKKLFTPLVTKKL